MQSQAELRHLEVLVRWADVILLVYSITDKASFHLAVQLLQQVMIDLLRAEGAKRRIKRCTELRAHIKACTELNTWHPLFFSFMYDVLSSNTVASFFEGVLYTRGGEDNLKIYLR